MHQLDARLVGVHTVDLTGAQIAEAPERAHGVLFDACGLGLQAGAGCIVLGGAALAGMAATLQPRLAIPLLDNVLLGAQAVVEAALRPPSALAPSDAPRIAVKGLSAALTRLLV
jgi:Asp/Glu/hydantoin racemase